MPDPKAMQITPEGEAIARVLFSPHPSESTTGAPAPIEPAVAILEIRGCCAACGWIYPQYQGHIEPCPRCALKEARKAMRDLLNLLPQDCFTLCTTLGRAMRRAREHACLR